MPAITLSGRLALPVVRKVDVGLAQAERARLAQLAARLAKTEPALSSYDMFGPAVRTTLDDAAAAMLPDELHRRVAAEAMQLAWLFQQLGYFGRCSFDAIIAGSDWPTAHLHWIECNGRWGGTSISMSLANWISGDWTRHAMMILQRGGLALPGCALPMALERLGGLLYRDDGDGTDVIVLTPGRLESGEGLHFLFLADDAAQVRLQMSQVEALFVELLQRCASADAALH